MATNSPPEVLIVLGTRPEIIKLAPVIRALEAADALSFRLLHTGQHYDEKLSSVFFENLKLPLPDASLDIGSGTQAEQTAAALCGIEQDVLTHHPNAVLALGDTNAVLSAALAVSKTDSEFVHLEAGIRSFDRSMPEEINRVVADCVTDIAFAPTENGVANLEDEGVTDGVYMVGNTVVDACREHASIAAEHSDVLERFGLMSNDYTVATIHRPRNTDDVDRLLTIARTLDGQEFPVVFPTHPRTQNGLNEVGFEPSDSLRLVDPLDYLDFLRLLDNARVAVTDSGGVQEETSILEVPCLTVRPNTERPETVDAGVNELLEPEELASRLPEVFSDDAIHDSMIGHTNLYGDGHTGKKIVKTLAKRYAD